LESFCERKKKRESLANEKKLENQKKPLVPRPAKATLSTLGLGLAKGYRDIKMAGNLFNLCRTGLFLPFVVVLESREKEQCRENKNFV
jgi:hypothetical protein